MLATNTLKSKERADILISMVNTLDNAESIEIPKGSIENTVSFLQGLFKENDGKQPSKVRSKQG